MSKFQYGRIILGKNIAKITSDHNGVNYEFTSKYLSAYFLKSDFVKQFRNKSHGNKMLINANETRENEAQSYVCQMCDYFTSDNYTFKRHLSTDKHL